MNAPTSVSSPAELASALTSGARAIRIEGIIASSPMITLPPGVTLEGGTLQFGAKGVRLTTDNTLDGVTVLTADDEVAILNDPSVAALGTLTLRNVRTIGQVLLVAEGAVRAGHVQVEGLQIDRANVRGRVRRPHGFGVEALQGAFTLWNVQPDRDVVITAELLDIGMGSAEHPVQGSGVFVGGHGDWDGKPDGGTVRVSELRTTEIHTDGGIPSGTPDLISGGVFVISGAIVEQVTDAGPVTTYGQNDMVLDNWGQVTTWTATAPVTSNGPSGIGFVNFGDLDRLDVQALIETHGPGARGFNLYDGHLREAAFASIATTGDGSVGIQVSKPLPSLSVLGDLTTAGGKGLSLVKGVQIPLEAIALSIKPGADVGTIAIGGRVCTSGDNVVTVEIDGKVDHFDVEGGIWAEGKESDAVHVTGTVPGLDDIELHAANGRTLVRSG